MTCQLSCHAIFELKDWKLLSKYLKRIFWNLITHNIKFLHTWAVKILFILVRVLEQIWFSFRFSLPIKWICFSLTKSWKFYRLRYNLYKLIEQRERKFQEQFLVIESKLLCNLLPWVVLWYKKTFLWNRISFFERNSFWCVTVFIQISIDITITNNKSICKQELLRK